MTKKKTSKFTIFIVSSLCFIIGVIGAFYGVTYFTLPSTEDVVSGNTFYSKTTNSSDLQTIELTGGDDEFSIHFLELGNKYTGDCTYIKAGDVDILIDCGSKSNSISTVTSYINQYVTDGKLEYVIITHAHQDHYAGFATSTSIDSIFDLYECENIITFSLTNQNETGTMYKNYLRELGEAVAKGANHYTAKDCIQKTNNAQKIFYFDEAQTMSMEILDNYYYYNTSSTENNYSVCCLFRHDSQSFLFTGDLESDGEDYLVDMNKEILPESVELYKAGHHGSKTSSSAKLMKAVRPKNICVCCCAGSSEYTTNNANQFPTQTFIDNVAPYTDCVYVTTLCIDYANSLFTSFNGNIVCISRDNSFSVNCSNNNTKLKDTEWFKENRTCPASWT